MKFPEERYYRLNYILLSSIGLWPYSNSSHIRFVLSLLMYISFISFQLIKLFVSEYSLDVLLDVLSADFMFLVWIFKYLAFYAVKQNIKKFPKLLRNNWSVLTDDQEIDILRKHSSTGKLFTVIIATCVYSGIFIFILFQYVPSILDIIVPLNESRLHTLFVRTEYFVDHQKYFHILAMHVNVGLLLVATTGVATESFALANSLHSFGLFKVASYRIKHILDENAAKLCDAKKHVIFHGKILAAIDIHKRAMEFSNLLVDSFGLSYLIMFVLALCAASTNLFYALRLMTLKQRIFDIVRSVVFVFFLALYLVLGNYAGQEFMNCDNHVYRTLCNTSWYNAPLKTQKMILFLIQKTTKTYKVSAGGMFTPCLESLASSVSTILSTVTVFFSV